MKHKYFSFTPYCLYKIFINEKLSQNNLYSLITGEIAINEVNGWHKIQKSKCGSLLLPQKVCK